MKILLGIIIGILIILVVKSVDASQKEWTIKPWNDSEVAKIIKIVDNNINCYISQSRYQTGGNSTNGISCVKVK